MLPRLQLFEFNDATWAPTLLREVIIEALSRTLAWAQVLRPLVKPFQAFLEKTQADTVIDLASGAGGPVRIFLNELIEAGGKVPRFVMTDILPAEPAWAELKADFPQVVDYVPTPVDVTAIPADLKGVRVIINALHHFPPELAQKALLGACEGAPGVFIAEGLVRNPLSFAAMAPAGIVALMLSPVLGRSNRVGRALLTWATPIALLASMWDGTVSTFRCYSEAELRAMVAPLGDSWEWTFGEFAFNPIGRGTYFWGVPRAR